MRRFFAALFVLVLALPAGAQFVSPPAQVVRDFGSFGGRCDGTTDDATAFSTAMTWLSAANNRELRLPAATCATSETVTVGNGRQQSTTLSDALTGGESTIPVTSTTGILSGDTIIIMLDDGSARSRVVASTPSGGNVPITVAMPVGAAAASGNTVFTGLGATWQGGQLVGYGSGSTEQLGAPAVSTIKYIGDAAPTTTLGAQANAGALEITVASAANINIHDPVGIVLNTGAVFWSQVRETPQGTTVKLSNEVPSTANNGNAVKISNVPVVRVAGANVGAVVRDVQLDANSLASTGLETISPRRGKFANVFVKGYTGIGIYMQSMAAGLADGSGTVDSEFEIHTAEPENTNTIGCWAIGTAGPSGSNNFNVVAFSRNRFTGTCTMGGADTLAAGLRIEFIDNNSFYRLYTRTNGANDAGAGVYRMPSYYRSAFPLENAFIASNILGGFTTATATGVSAGIDYVYGYGVSDAGQDIPAALNSNGGVAGVTTDGQYFGVTQLTTGQIAPVLLQATSFTTASNVYKTVVTSGRYAYAVSGASGGNTLVHVIDITNPSAMVEVSETDIGSGNPNGKASLAGGYLFIPVTDGTNSLRIVDVSNPNAPSLVSTINTANAGVGALALSGRVLFIGTRTGGVFRAYDISNPASPVQLSTLSLTNVTRITSIALQGKYAYVGQLTTTDKGFEVIDVSNPSSTSSAGSYDANADVHGLAVSGRYAYLSKSDGVLDVVNIANPAAIASVGTLTLTSTTASSSSGTMPLAGRYLYVPGASAASGIQIVDVSTPTAPALSVLGNTSNNTGTDIAISGNTLFAVTNGTTNNFRSYTIAGGDIAAVRIGAAAVDELRVASLSRFDGQIHANAGLVAGPQGVFSRGQVAAAGLTLLDGHIIGKGTAPALTSCGTSPAIVGSDTAGTVTMGTGTPTGCVITFAVPYIAAPICTVTWRATPLASQSYTTSTTALTLTQTATSSNLVDYTCVARSGG